MSKTNSLILVTIVVAALPLGLLLTPLFIYLAPWGLFLTITMVLCGLLIRGLGRSLRSGARLLTLRGLRGRPAVRRELRDALEGLLDSAPAGMAPLACACIKPCADGSCQAQIRLRSSHGSGYFEVRGPTVEQAAIRASALIQERRREGVFPILVGQDPQDLPACNRAACPRGTRSIFYLPYPAQRAAA